MTANLLNLHTNSLFTTFVMYAHTHNKTFLQQHLCECFQNLNSLFVTYHSKLFTFYKIDQITTKWVL